MEKISAYGVIKFTARKPWRVVVSFAQVEKVALAVPTEERCVPDERVFGAKVQSVTRREVLTVEIV